MDKPEEVEEINIESNDLTADAVDSSELPPHIARRLNGLRKLHQTVADIDVEYKLERIQLEAKFKERRSIVYEERKQVITGVVDVPDEDGNIPVPTVDEEKGIPNFWLQALVNHPVVSDLITEEDLPALEALEDIKCDYNETYTTFSLSFYFKENPFFTNEILTKTYTLDPDVLDEKAPSLVSTENTEIIWKPSQNLCVKEIKKKQKAKSGRNKGQVRTVVRQEPKASFFHYFSKPKEDEEEQEEEEGEMPEKILLTEEEDFEIAHAIRTAILPDALLWFTGEARDEMYDDYEEDGDEDEDEGDEGEDGDEDDEEEDKPAQKPKKGSKGNKADKSAAGAPGDPQPECKQN